MDDYKTFEHNAYHMGWGEVYEAYKILGVKTLVGLCNVHLNITGYPLCTPQTLYNQISRSGCLSLPISRSIHMLCVLIQQNKVIKQLEAVQNA